MDIGGFEYVYILPVDVNRATFTGLMSTKASIIYITYQ